jgi:hypothetical protein
LRWAISTANIVAITPANVRVTNEIVIVIDVDVVAAPAAAPAPTAAPKRTHHHSHAKRNRQAGGVVSCRRVVNRWVGIQGRTPNHHRVIRRYINDLGTRRFDHDHTFVLDYFGFYSLLFSRFQVAFVLGLLPHALHGIHHVALLGQKGVA